MNHAELSAHLGDGRPLFAAQAWRSDETDDQDQRHHRATPAAILTWAQMRRTPASRQILVRWGAPIPLSLRRLCWHSSKARTMRTAPGPMHLDKPGATVASRLALGSQLAAGGRQVDENEPVRRLVGEHAAGPIEPSGSAPDHSLTLRLEVRGLGKKVAGTVAPEDKAGHGRHYRLLEAGFFRSWRAAVESHVGCRNLIANLIENAHSQPAVWLNRVGRRDAASSVSKDPSDSARRPVFFYGCVGFALRR
jgi:hypothetical protein